MKGKIKTSILIDRDLWEAFKVKTSSKQGLRGVSKAVEEALEEGLIEKAVIETLDNMCTKKPRELQVKPVKPNTPTSAGKVISELRAHAA